jgi:hypothetical protein
MTMTMQQAQITGNHKSSTGTSVLKAQGNENQDKGVYSLSAQHQVFILRR